MCGRTACTLAPDDICKACSFKDAAIPKESKYVSPQWKDHPGNHNYFPSTNIAPSKFTPVLLRADTVSGTKRDSEDNIKDNYIVQPMMWGLIPFFFKGPTPSSFTYKTNNCRIEDIEEKKLFLPSLKRGQRCIVLCDGFYEWQTTKGDKHKQPYLIFAPQPEGIEIWNRSSWESEKSWTEKGGWEGPQLLKMAGLYSVWTSPEGEEIYSYTVITTEASDKFSWLHHRIPAILDTEEEIKNWFNSGDIDYKAAISQLKNEGAVGWHPVSTQVNNSRNQERDLMNPVSLKKKESGSSKLMANWLKKGTTKSDSEDKD